MLRFLRPILLATLFGPLAAVSMFPHAAVATTIRFNCGGGDYTRDDGRVYGADEAYPGSQGAGYTGNSWDTSFILAVGGTLDDGLYNAARAGFFTYHFDVPDGEYLLELSCNEFRVHNTELRTQRVIVDGVVAIDSLDVAGLVWKDHALDIRLPIVVTGGATEVTFIFRNPSWETYALLSAISLTSRASDSTPPAPPGGLTALGGYDRNIVSWSRRMDDDVAGYRVYRTEVITEPFQLVHDVPGLVEWVFDDSAEAGITYHYKVSTVDAYGNESLPSATVSAQPLFPAASPLTRYEMTIDPDHLQDLYKFPIGDVERSALLSVNGAPPDSIGVRFRGGFSRHFGKKSWRLEVPLPGPEDDTWKINLNAEGSEYAIIRERVAYEIFDRLGVPTPSTRWAYYGVNGTHMGVHLDVERIGKAFLEPRGLDDDSSVYKCKGNLSVLGSPEEYETAYEKVTNEELPHDDIIQLIESINQLPAGQFPEYIAWALDLHGYFKWYTGIMLTGEVDFTVGNYYLVHDLEDDRWHILPWDNDMTFGMSYPYDTFVECTTAIDQGTVSSPGQLGGPNMLVERLLQFDPFRWMYASYLEAALDSLYQPDQLHPVVDAEYAAIAFDAHRDRYKVGYPRNELFDDGPGHIRDYVTCRRAFLLSEIDGFRPDLDYPFRLNELMPVNSTTIPDDFGEFEDWVEIVNISDQPASLAGWHLNDDFDRPYYWSLPDTILPPGGFIVVWADDEPVQGPLHAPFKLSGSGEELALFAPVSGGGVVVDHVVFGAMGPDQSMGRSPDGIGNWLPMPTPTPGEPNAEPVAVPGALAPPSSVWLDVPGPNPFADRTRLTYAAPAGVPLRVQVYDVTGRAVRVLAEARGADSVGEVVWDGTDTTGRSVPPGVYFVRLTAGSHQVSRKVVRFR